MTRNVRLAAIKSFFRFLEYRQPAALEHVRRVLAIPFKKTVRRLVPYLLREELQAVLRFSRFFIAKGVKPSPYCSTEARRAMRHSFVGVELGEGANLLLLLVQK